MSEVNNNAVIKIMAKRDREFKELNDKYLIVCGKLSDSINDKVDLRIENVELRKLLKEAQKDCRMVQESLDGAQREIERLSEFKQSIIDYEKAQELTEEDWEDIIRGG